MQWLNIFKIKCPDSLKYFFKAYNALSHSAEERSWQWPGSTPRLSWLLGEWISSCFFLNYWDLVTIKLSMTTNQAFGQPSERKMTNYCQIMDLYCSWTGQLCDNFLITKLSRIMLAKHQTFWWCRDNWIFLTAFHHISMTRVLQVILKYWLNSYV